MSFARPAIQTALFLLAVAPGLPAAAQPVPAASPTPAPSTWTVLQDETRGMVRIAAASRGGVAQFVGGCNKGGEPGLVGAFSHYLEGGLRTDGTIEHVALYARGEDWQDAFSLQLRYDAARQSWQFVEPLAPVFLSSFSRGATLAVVNSRNEEVFSFDLTGSTAAVRALRTVCGIEAVS